MFNQTTLIQQTIASEHYNQGGGEHLRSQAAQFFWRLNLVARWSSFWHKLRGQSTDLQDLNQVEREMTFVTRRYAGMQTVALADIQGSEGRCTDFDNRFRPLQSHNQDRWVGLYAAWQSGAVMPPVELVCVNGRYFVRDGHHRISIARFLGQAEIEAKVTMWETAV